MPRKKSEIPLRRRYSDDLKQRVIYQAFTLGKKSTEIAIDLEIPLRVVQHVKHTWMQTGRVSRPQEFMGRHPLLSPDQTKVFFSFPVLKYVLYASLQFMLALVEHSPDIYLDEIQGQLLELHNIKVSLSSICRTLKWLGMSSKKVCNRASSNSTKY